MQASFQILICIYFFLFLRYQYVKILHPFSVPQSGKTKGFSTEDQASLFMIAASGYEISDLSRTENARLCALSPARYVPVLCRRCHELQWGKVLHRKSRNTKFHKELSWKKFQIPRKSHDRPTAKIYIRTSEKFFKEYLKFS